MDKNKSILTHLIGNCALYGFRWFGTDDEKWFCCKVGTSKNQKYLGVIENRK